MKVTVLPAPSSVISESAMPIGSKSCSSKSLGDSCPWPPAAPAESVWMAELL